MSLRIATMIGLVSWASLAVPHAFSQVLLSQAFLSQSVGANVITNSLNLAIGVSPDGAHAVPLLFQGLWVHHDDVGHIYTVTPSDDYADFSLYTRALTNGSVSFLCSLWKMGSGGGTPILPETRFFSSLPPGNNGVDFGGFEIDYYTLVLNTLDFLSPGSDPNGNGIWTDCTYSATFSVYGEPIPEPTSVAFFCLGIAILCVKSRLAATRTD